MSIIARIVVIFVVFYWMSFDPILCKSNDGSETTAMNPTTKDGEPTQAPGPTPTPEVACNKRNVSCGDCVEEKSCFYCWKSKSCHYYPFQVLHPVPETCGDLADMSYMTCLVSEKTLWIAIGTGSGTLLVALLLVFYCCCCRKKSSAERLIDDLAKSDSKRTTRRAELDERRREREARHDAMRAKYGLKGSPFN